MPRNPKSRNKKPGVRKRKIYPPSVSHDKKMIELLRRDSKFATEYLKAAMEDQEVPEVLLIALRHITEARGGIKKMARKAKVDPESLHRAFSGRISPRVSTLSAVGLRLTVEPV
jgi:DNA-binding phage protein